MLKFMLPMFSVHISGLATRGAFQPFVQGHGQAAAGGDVITASVFCLIRGRNCMNTFGRAWASRLPDCGHADG